MKRAATVALALGAVIGAGLSPASAQVIVGGMGEPDVQVNLSVLDRLGPVPTLADMLKADIPTSSMRSLPSPTATRNEAITFRPYVETKKKVAKTASPAVAPAAQASPAVAELAAAAQAVKEARRAAALKPVDVVISDVKPALPPKPQLPEVVAKKDPAPAPAVAEGPKVSLPETPAPPVVAKADPIKPEPARAAPAVPAPASSKVDPAKPEPAPGPSKVEPAKVEPAKVDPAKVDPAKVEPMKLVPAAKPVEPAKTEPAKVEIAKVSEPVPAPAKVDPAAAPPAVAPAAAPAPQVAALPSAAPSVQTHGDTMSILFSGEVARLPDASRAELERLAKRLEKDESLGLQLLAYAEGDEANASRARRLSLSRALEVRKFLMEQGVRSTRIEVRALGNKSDGGPADRVDAIVVAR